MSFRFLRPLVGLIGASLAAAIKTAGKAPAAFVGNPAVINKAKAPLT